MNRESGVDTYSLPCVKRRAGAKLLQNRNGSVQLCGGLGVGRRGRGEAGRPRRVGIRVSIELGHLLTQQKLTRHCKAIILQ